MRAHTALRRLLVFARDPVPGRVKTRLIPALGRAAATALYREMLRTTLDTAMRVGATQTQLWLDRTPADPTLLQLARDYRLAWRIQQGPDLGTRMAHALTAATDTGGTAILIGSDCPDIDVGYLETAFAALSTHDVVIGPATDGGYVLIGLHTPRPALFRDIAWGTGQVLETTRRRLRDLGLRWHELPPRRDLDEPHDLVHFPRLAALVDRMHASDGTA